MRIPRLKLNYANVIATIALFVALGGAAVAAGLPKKSVGPQQLKAGAVTTKALHRQAVRSGKIAPEAVTAGKLGPFAVLPGNLGNGIISTEKLGDGSVIAAKIKNGVVTTNKLDGGAVTSAKLDESAVNNTKLADGSVSLNKLGKTVIGQLQTSTLESGQTLRGAFDVGAGGKETEAGDEAQGAVSYQFPLAKAPNSTVLLPGETTAECPGGTTNNFTPLASPGRVCVYIIGYHNLDTTDRPNTLIDSRVGFGIAARAAQAGESFSAYGLWAVTAP